MSLTARKVTRISAAEYLAAENDGLELFRRRTDWQREFYQQDNTVTLESVGLTINVSSLYRGVDFDDPAPPPAA
jgi:hypothetical protein